MSQPTVCPGRPVGPHSRPLVRVCGGSGVVSLLVALLGANSLYLAGVTALEAASGSTYENYFYQYMFLGHLVEGFVLIVPFLLFAAIHLRNTLMRRNRRAVRIGYVLLAMAVLLLASGILLTRLGPLELKTPRPGWSCTGCTSSRLWRRLALLAASSGRPANPCAEGWCMRPSSSRSASHD